MLLVVLVALVLIFRRFWVSLLALPTKVVVVGVVALMALEVQGVSVVVAKELTRHLHLLLLARRTLVAVAVAETVLMLLLLVVQVSFTFVSVTTHKEKQCPNTLHNSTTTTL
jgi:hypothetical protein